MQLCCSNPLNIIIAAKRAPGKSKEEAQLEKKHELEKRLEDVKGQLSGGQQTLQQQPQQSSKKNPKKGELCDIMIL